MLSLRLVQMGRTYAIQRLGVTFGVPPEEKESIWDVLLLALKRIPVWILYVAQQTIATHFQHANVLEFCSHPSWTILENLCLWPLPPDGPSSPSPLLSLTSQHLSLFSRSVSFLLLVL
ncbi:hypothetical protein L345_17983 [Ophiophagus hannah]|uniref:Uncharacterized protein n=1 Tax=Ophiophagus hannah TaxID=8665 RepID=V8N329_OPHHA|nr:hypothetical protein L345_17983 [Ophiophagus hannah]